MAKIIKFLTCFTVACISTVIIAISGAYLYFAPNLPDVDTLTDIQLQVPLRIYSNDGLLIGEFGEQRRTPVAFQDVPTDFINAFLAAEDDQFYHHPGISIKGLARAGYQMLSASDTQTGGSTITMQVAKNYFLTPERNIIRKIREIFLAIEIERKLEKEQILELYINKIFLGHRAYGINAAAQVYYGKPIDELNLAQFAMIAGLPKAPSSYNPISNPERALIRRNWILQRMLALGYIDNAQYQYAFEQPVTAKRHRLSIDLHAPYIAEMARLEILSVYGENAYTDGLRVYTTVNGTLQDTAQNALRSGLHSYDERHGYRRPQHLADTKPETLESAFSRLYPIAGLVPAVAMEVHENHVVGQLHDGSQFTIEWENGLEGQRPYITENRVGREAGKAADIVRVGDVIRVSRDDDDNWHLRQLPDAEGALVSLNPDNGAILALVGGYDFYKSRFNRATQAERQIGSTIKPFVYAAALSQGFTAASIVNDAPIVVETSQLEEAWRPRNAGAFAGPIRLREALYQSKNLVSVRVLRDIGVGNAINYISRFGFERDKLPRDLSLALGSPSFTPMTVSAAFATFANGGYKIEPYLIDRIYDSHNELVYQAIPATVCHQCDPFTFDSENPLSDDTPLAPRIIDEDAAFIINDILRDVIQRGTARRARSLGRDDIAGKTGTTNGPTDAWFAGYHANVVTTTWIGFDNNSPLGHREFGGSAALPIWIEYMQEALSNQPVIHREQPDSVVSVLIDRESGKRSRPGAANSMFEYIQATALDRMEMKQDASKESPAGIEDLF